MSDRVAALEAELAQLRAERDALAQAVEAARPYQRSALAAPIAIFSISGTTGRHIFANDACSKMFGYTREELEAADPYEVWVKSALPEDFQYESGMTARIARGEIDGYQYEGSCSPRTGSGSGFAWISSSRAMPMGGSIF